MSDTIYGDQSRSLKSGERVGIVRDSPQIVTYRSGSQARSCDDRDAWYLLFHMAFLGHWNNISEGSAW